MSNMCLVFVEIQRNEIIKLLQFSFIETNLLADKIYYITTTNCIADETKLFQQILKRNLKYLDSSQTHITVFIPLSAHGPVAQNHQI